MESVSQLLDDELLELLELFLRRRYPSLLRVYVWRTMIDLNCLNYLTASFFCPGFCFYVDHFNCEWLDKYQVTFFLVAKTSKMSSFSTTIAGQNTIFKSDLLNSSLRSGLLWSLKLNFKSDIPKILSVKTG